MVIVLAPSRGRPDRAKEMVTSFLDTKELDDTQLVVVIDETDLTRKEYSKLGHYKGVRVIQLWGEETGNLTRATNTAARRYWSSDVILGHVGDDHLFRTQGWDVVVESALAEPGVAYGDDLLQHEHLPTAVFMSSIIPRTLDWYALPDAFHLYIDNAWKSIGEGIGALHYLPEVVIEHMHPAVGKAEMDEGYATWNSEQTVIHDRRAYEHWRDRRMKWDIQRIKDAIK